MSDHGNNESRQSPLLPGRPIPKGVWPPKGFVLVRTNGMVPEGVYDLDTSADGYYLNPLADPDQNVWDFLDGAAPSGSSDAELVCTQREEDAG